MPPAMAGPTSSERAIPRSDIDPRPTLRGNNRPLATEISFILQELSMFTHLLDHVYGIVGYKYSRTEYDDGQLIPSVAISRLDPCPGLALHKSRIRSRFS